MPHFGPVRRKDLIRYLVKLGFNGPFSGGRHEFMLRESDGLRLTHCNGPQKLDSFLAILRGYPAPTERVARRPRTQQASDIPRQSEYASSCTRPR